MPPEAAPAVGRPKGVDAPMNHSREAHHPARPLHPQGMTSGDPPPRPGRVRTLRVGSA
jgi:hypothetical protein